jgi:nitroreductase
VRKRGEISLEDLRQMFVSDPDVATALDRGAAVIVIAADPSRIIHKYGNRGWRYALIECGAVMHHIMLAATSHKEAVRPIGGYFDLLLQQAVCDQALPLLTFLVMVGQ